MANTLRAFINLYNTEIREFDEDYNVSNRVNQVGDAFEKFIKDLYADSLGKADYKELHQNVFSYLGNKNNPPDAILKNSDAIEIKKIESEKGSIALNSSFPKDYFYRDDPLITTHCVNCELDVDLPEERKWRVKDMLYIIGFIKEKRLQGVWFVYGDCYAADRSIYKTIKDTVTTGIKQLDLELVKTNEFAKVNKVDPLGITDLRVRGMWSIQHPARVFSSLNLRTDTSFFAHLIMKKSKYDSFPTKDKNKMDALIQKDREKIMIQNNNIENPNNPAHTIDVIVVSICQ